MKIHSHIPKQAWWWKKTSLPGPIVGNAKTAVRNAIDEAGIDLSGITIDPYKKNDPPPSDTHSD